MLEKILTAPLVFYRTYSRRLPDGTRESWVDMVDRTTKGLVELGKLTETEAKLIRSHQLDTTALTSGRWQWVGGTDWVSKPENYQGAYNCSNLIIDSFDRMAYAMDLLMQGCGVGTVLESDIIAKLPPITTQLILKIEGHPGLADSQGIAYNPTESFIEIYDRSRKAYLTIGDSRQGWIDAYLAILNLAANRDIYDFSIELTIDLSYIRAAGTPIKGFGGTANPAGLSHLFERMVAILNNAQGRQLTPLEVCLLMDEASLAVVAGNVRRSANIRQFSYDDLTSANSKLNLWQQDKNGKWQIDPERDALRMSNHTRVFHHKPTREECIEAVRSQYYSGEGAIQWAGESVARANADILDSKYRKQLFLNEYTVDRDYARSYLEDKILDDFGGINEKDLDHRMMRYGTNPCLAAGNLIVTSNGNFPVESLVDRNVDIWDGKSWTTVRFQVTGENVEVWTVITDSGAYAIATPNHEFVLVGGVKRKLIDLQYGDIIQCHTKGILGKDIDFSYLEVSSVYLSHVADKVYCCNVPTTHNFALANGMMSGNCGEIILNDNFCNLSEVHLNLVDPFDSKAQESAFKAAALSAYALLHHKFNDERMQYSREVDPIVGVSFTGLFDFFVNAFGVSWLKWWEAGRPEKWEYPCVDTPIKKACEALNIDIDEYENTLEDGFNLGFLFSDVEQAYLSNWRLIVEDTVREYCDCHYIPCPNRCTTVQPAGTKSLLTGASPGWHPPKSQRFIRRITFTKNDPVALTAIDCGYNVVPSQSSKDENGNLLDDPFDPRVTEWLVEVPIAANWADLPGAEDIEISQFSALAQFDFYMQVQKYYTTHNTSATIEYREDEIEALGERIYKAIRDDEGYISAALLARFDDNQTFPRLPFEPIDRDTYEDLLAQIALRRKPGTFDEHLADRDKQAGLALKQFESTGPMACDSDKCLLPTNEDK